MPSSSHLRIQTSFEPISAETTRSRFVTSPPQKKQKMSLTQTYYIAASARSKLGKEASRADHNLRLLVGHANLLDSLMVELQDAERQQEAWFHSTVAKASKAEEPRHVQWVDRIVEEMEEDSDSDSDSDDSDFYDEEGDFNMIAAPRRVEVTTTEVDEDDEEDQEYDDLEDDADLALTRVSSQQSPPELVHDEDSDDESPPVSPPSVSMEFSQKELAASYYDAKSQSSLFEHELHYLRESNAPLFTSY